MCKDPAAISRRSPGLEPVLCNNSAVVCGEINFFKGEFSIPFSLTCTRLSSWVANKETQRDKSNLSRSLSCLYAFKKIMKNGIFYWRLLLRRFYIIHTAKIERSKSKTYLSKLGHCRLSELVQMFPRQMFLLGAKAGEKIIHPIKSRFRLSL